MIGVGEDDGRAKFFKRFVRQGLNGCCGSHRHECRGFNLPMRSGDAAAPRAGRIGLFYFERKIHLRSLAAAAAKTLRTPLSPKPTPPRPRIRYGTPPPV